MKTHVFRVQNVPNERCLNAHYVKLYFDMKPNCTNKKLFKYNLGLMFVFMMIWSGPTRKKSQQSANHVSS